MKWACQCVVELVTGHNQKNRLVTLDKWISSLDPSRNSKRQACPTSTFRQGISNLTKIMVQESPVVILQLTAALAQDEHQKLMPRRRMLPVVKALDRLYRVDLWIGQESMQAADVAVGGPMERELREYLELFKEASADAKETRCKFYKHLPLRYPEFIRRFGSTISGAAYTPKTATAFRSGSLTAGQINSRRAWSWS